MVVVPTVDHLPVGSCWMMVICLLERVAPFVSLSTPEMLNCWLMRGLELLETAVTVVDWRVPMLIVTPAIDSA